MPVKNGSPYVRDTPTQGSLRLISNDQINILTRLKYNMRSMYWCYDGVRVDDVSMYNGCMERYWVLLIFVYSLVILVFYPPFCSKIHVIEAIFLCNYFLRFWFLWTREIHYISVGVKYIQTSPFYSLLRSTMINLKIRLYELKNTGIWTTTKNREWTLVLWNG